MSRIRSIHPGIWTDEDFVTLSPLARLFFLGIWNECDDRGIFQWSPLQLKMRILPMEGAQPDKLLFELVDAGFVLSYMHSGKQYGAVKNFMKFQHPKKPRNIHPITEDVQQFVSDGEPVPNEFPSGGEPVPIGEEGREGEGNEGEDSCASGDALEPEHIVEHWNEIAPTLGKPCIRKLTPARRSLLKARIGQNELEDFVEVFANIRASPFLRGDKGWRGCTFDWVFKQANFQKILEGNYNEQPAR